MTYESLLSDVYRRFDALLAVWNGSAERSEDPGAFVFLPHAYQEEPTLATVKIDLWADERVGDFLRARSGTDEGFRSVRDDVAPGEEFVVMIVEPEDTLHRQPVHVHRIMRVGGN